MKSKTHIFALFLALSACSQSSVSTLLSQQPTYSLWQSHRHERDPIRLAMIEAELGLRGQFSSGLYQHLSSKTATLVGETSYTRLGIEPSSTDTKNCSDFSSDASAQKFFLASGGPHSDPHNLDRDGDGFACEWGTKLKRTVSKYAYRPAATVSSYSRCYVGPRGGTYTITASGRKNYGGC